MSEQQGNAKGTLVVFTDLDGTLLDARTYSWAPAREALRRLAARAVPVVFCSSKTAAEQRPLRCELGLEHTPYIVENGAAVLVPHSSGLAMSDWPCAAGEAGERVRVLGPDAATVRAGIRRAAAAAGVRATGYSDLTVSEVAALTGLDEAAAARARQRDYSETLVDEYSPAEWAALQAALTAEGLCGRHGGRFHTVTGIGTDKGRAVQVVVDLFAAAGGPVRTAALGDSANDTSLLAAVDRPYLLAHPDGTWARMTIPNLRRLPKAGPQGWNDAILELFPL